MPHVFPMFDLIRIGVTQKCNWFGNVKLCFVNLIYIRNCFTLDGLSHLHTIWFRAQRY